MKVFLRTMSLLIVSLLVINLFDFYGPSIVADENAYDFTINETDGFTYGIFTENYSIEYHKDINGNIIMSRESLEQLSDLSNDSSSVGKILNGKVQAGKDVNYSTSAQAINKLKDLDVFAYEGDNVVITAEQRASVENLTNFTATLDIVNAYPIEDDGFFLRLRYRWWWNYAPANTFVDKVVIAWSDDFDNLYDETLSDGTLVQTRFNYYQTGYPVVYNSVSGSFDYDYDNPYKYTSIAAKGSDAYTSVVPSERYETAFDIKNSFNYNGQKYVAFKHSGSMYVNVGRGTVEGFDKIFNCHGAYMHKKIAIGDFSPGYSPGKNGGFSLSVAAQVVYDLSASATSEIKYSEILNLMS